MPQADADGLPGDVSVSLDEDATLIIFSGEVDLALQDELAVAYRLAVDRGLPVRVDMRQLSFIDSAGLSFLAELVKTSDLIGSPVAVEGASRRVVESLTITGLMKLLSVSD